MTIDPCRSSIAESLSQIVQKSLGPEGQQLSVEDIFSMLEKPPKADMGDYALPCFRFAKALKSAPNKIAENFATELKDAGNPWVESTAATGAFLNVFIDASKLAEHILPLVKSDKAFGMFAEKSERVMIEFSQPNTHKEFHVGHSRNAFLGNALVRLYRYCGYPVVGVNYFGDEGTHIAKCLWHINKSGEKAPQDQRGRWLGSMYAAADRALKSASEDEQQEIRKEIGDVLAAIESKNGPLYDQWLETREWSLDDFKDIYKWFHIDFDHDFFESEVSEESQMLVDEYLEKGVFVLDDGAVGVDLKEYKLGFCILRKRDGNTLYATKDLALAKRKFGDFQIDRSIYVVGNEQNHHFKQVFKVLDLMGFEQAKNCYHLSYGMVVLPEGKMSSRDGTNVSFHELTQMVDSELDKILDRYRGEWDESELAEARHRLCEGSLKYGMLSTDPSGQIVFNLQDWLSFEGNSGPYLMYSFSRTQSILRKGRDADKVPAHDNLNLLQEASEKELLRFIYDFNKVVESAAENYKPSTLLTHLFYMCKSFNRFYTDVSVLKAETDDLVAARLALIEGFSKTLAVGLSLVGITPPERM